MRKTLILFWILGSAFFFSSCSHGLFLAKHNQKITHLQKQIRTLLDDPTIANAHIGIYIESLKDGEVLFAQNPFKLFVPASNMKLFTTATALVKLGPEYRFKTPLLHSGRINKHVLDGDLIVVGSGDPSISGRLYQADPLVVFRQWADSLKKKGITVIKGRIVGDNHFFKNPELGDGWNWDDESYWYAAKISALSLNDNCVDVAVFPDSVAGAAVHVKIIPKYSDLKIINRAITVDSTAEDELNIYRLPGENTIVLEGTMSVQSDTLWEPITVENPAQFFVDLLKQTLQEQGITVQGEALVLPEQQAVSDSLHLLFTHYSKPLWRLIQVVNKPSHNFYAEQLLKTLGATFEGEGTFEAGARVVHDFLNSIGVADAHFINVDGSGLSRKNLVAPIATATLLRYMYFHPSFDYFLQSLPIAGIDGTLKRRMVGTIAQGNVHAKTGYVRHVRALSGYANLEHNEPLLFVMMFNHYSVPTPKINLIQDKIAILLSAFAD